MSISGLTRGIIFEPEIHRRFQLLGGSETKTQIVSNCHNKRTNVVIGKTSGKNSFQHYTITQLITIIRQKQANNSTTQHKSTN